MPKLFKEIVCLVGLSGSGKTTVREVIAKSGMATIYTKDFHDTLQGAHQDVDKMSFGNLYEQPNGFISAVLNWANERYASEPTLVLDSIRSVHELQYVRHIAETLQLVQINCPDKLRLNRLLVRDPMSSKRAIRHRDAIDLGKERNSRFDLQSVFAHSDEIIYNSGSLCDLKEQIFLKILEPRGIKYHG